MLKLMTVAAPRPYFFDLFGVCLELGLQGLQNGTPGVIFKGKGGIPKVVYILEEGPLKKVSTFWLFLSDSRGSW